MYRDLYNVSEQYNKGDSHPISWQKKEKLGPRFGRGIGSHHVSSSNRKDFKYSRERNLKHRKR